APLRRGFFFVAPFPDARVAKLVDAWDLKSPGRKAMWVRPPPRAPPEVAETPMLPNRYWPFASCLLLTVLASVAALYVPLAGWGVVAFGALSLVGLWDLLQRKHTLRRNYPLTAHFRYGLESIGP